jgi:hypothetical protein
VPSPGYNPPVPLLAPLGAEQRTTFLVVALPQKTLRKLVGRLGTAPSGTRLDTMSVWDLAWSLVDYYEEDPEVSGLVDRTLRKDVAASPLAGAVAGAGDAEAVTALLLDSKDPARDLAWALLSAAPPEAGPLAARCVETIIADYDEVERRAREEEEAAAQAAAAGGGEAAAPPPAPVDDEAERTAREAARARSERDRALKRVGGLKERLVELERSLAESRRELKATDEARVRADTERTRLQEERETLRAQLRTGTAAEARRLSDELEAAARRIRALEGDLEEARETESTLAARVRSLEERAARPGAGPPAEEPERPAAGAGPGWSLPVFTDEFYESIRRWDRRIVRNAFEKIYRLAEDWRHPSLRAIPLEGLPDYYRIRVATDVRLIYRPLDGNRVEVLSLIDREDLQRYVRQAKSR